MAPSARSLLRQLFPPPPPSHGWPPYVWLVYLVPVLITVVAGRVTPVIGGVTLALLVVFLSSYLHAFHATGGRLLALAALQAGIGVVLAPWHPFAPVFGVYGAATAARHERVRVAWGAMAALVACAALAYWLMGALSMQMIGIGVVAPVIGAVTLHDERARRADAALAAANARMATLATSAERERIARDLHDVLGHTLSLVVLKAQVARRLMASDTAAAQRELDELETAARGALTEVRRTIRGYRATLDDEVSAARALLTAAGVVLDARIELPAPSPTRDAVLAPVLRELVTNVARHAAASQCTVRVQEEDGLVRLSVTDDGRGGARTDGGGLTGVATRVRDAGGTLRITSSATSPDTPGTTVEVVLPAPHSATMAAESEA